MSVYGTNSYMMAAEAAAEIVSQKLEILLSHSDWAGCSSMETLVKDAKAKLAIIQKFFSTRDRPSKTTEWWGRFLQTMYDAENILDKFHLKVACKRHEALQVATWPITSLVSRCMLWRDLSSLGKAMKELCQDQYLIDKKKAGGQGKKETASPSSHSSAPWEGQKLARLTSFWDWQASTNYDCHETKKEDIMKLIGKESEGLYGISIWGAQGSGKTLLAGWVYREALSQGFNKRAWVHVSNGMDQRDFLFEILKQVYPIGRDAMELHEIRETLSQKLAKPNRCLIVLDDVRRSHLPLLLELLKTIDPSSSLGDIITTTQDEMIATIMSDAPQRIHLEDLREKESRKLLATKLHRPHDLELFPVEKKILKRCPASPLCISLLGGILLCAKEDERTTLADSDSKIEVSELIHLSYRRLPVHLKPCFIYMALFPMASPISTRRLVRLWLAEGLLDSHCRNRERKMTPEDVGETFILELADRNVIDVVSWRVDGSPKACQMLTSLCDLVCSTVMSTGFLHVHNASKLKGRNDPKTADQQQQLLAALQERARVWWLAEHTNIVRDGCGDSYPKLDLSHVRSFLSFYPRTGMLTRDISTFLRKMTSKADYSVLRVLDLEGVYKPSLQGVLRKLVLLRYLGLRSTVLDSIPSEVADLHYLETLDIKHTNITSLPSSLWKARNLRHLHLSWFYIDLKKILKACSNNVTALTQLQTLGGLVIGEAKENSLTGHMNSLTTLTTLKLFLQHSHNDTSGDAGKTVARWISSKLTNLQSLTFGVIQEAKAAEEAAKEATKVAEPAKKATKVAEPAEEATEVAKLVEEPKPAHPEKEAEPAKKATKVAEPAEEATEVAKPVEEPKPAHPEKEAEPAKKATKVAEPAEEATEVAKPVEEPKPAHPEKEAKPAEVAEPAKGAAEVANPVEEAKSAEVAEPAKGAAEMANLAEEAEPATLQIRPLPEPTKGAAEVANPAEAKPATSQIGPLPELSLAQHHQLFELYLLGQLKDPIWTQLLPGSLRVLTLSGSKVEMDIIPQLGRLLRNLRTLRLLANSFLGTSLRFIKDGFPSLTILKIWKPPQLEEVIIDQGAIPHLKELEFRHLKRLTTVVGIHNRTELNVFHW